MTTAGGQTLSYTYDALKRHTATTVTKNGSTIFRVAKAYYNHATDSTRTTAQVQYYNVRNSAGTLIAGSQYVYDKLGNIKQIKESESPFRVLVEYDYDSLNQLTKETTYTYSGTSTTVNTTTVNRFEYDTAGNLLRVYDSATATEPVDKYTYGDQDWQDLLTKFNGTTINYDASGNPLNWYNGNTYSGLTWTMGRQLESLTMETDTENIGMSYTYDMSGMRSSKTVVYGVGEAHTHEYTSSVTAPTCTTAGYTTYTCDCGESYVDNLVDALGHNYVQSGNVYTCSRCGDSYTGHEHTYTEQTTEPTCLTAGYTVYTCSCGDSYTVEIPALGHNYVLVGQSGNVATYECSRCGHRYTAVIPVDPNPPVEYSLRSGTTVTEHHEYVYASGQLMRETITTTANGTSTIEVLDFVYGSGSTPLALVYTNGTANPVTYYYVTNMQGDVVKLVTASGTAVATYAYDAWGKVLSATGSMAEVNPIRYRGYYYDAETELYYLQSRYYDPAVRRFVNADGVATTGQGFLGHNMFSYCNNNPANAYDPSGYAANWFCQAEYCDGGTSIYIAVIAEDPVVEYPEEMESIMSMILPSSRDLYEYLDFYHQIPRKDDGFSEVYINIYRHDEMFYYDPSATAQDVINRVTSFYGLFDSALVLAGGAGLVGGPAIGIAGFAISVIPEGQVCEEGSYLAFTVQTTRVSKVPADNGIIYKRELVNSVYLWNSSGQFWYEGIRCTNTFENFVALS